MSKCTCGRENETSPAMHAGTCPVWTEHHNQMNPRIIGAPRVTHAFDGCVHVAVSHSNDLLESKKVDNVLLAEAREWCRKNGFTSPSKISAGWSLGQSMSETRGIYTFSRPENLESLRRAREI